MTQTEQNFPLAKEKNNCTVNPEKLSTKNLYRFSWNGWRLEILCTLGNTLLAKILMGRFFVVFVRTMTVLVKFHCFILNHYVKKFFFQMKSSVSVYLHLQETNYYSVCCRAINFK